MTRVQTVRDSGLVRVAGIEEAMLHRMDARTPMTDNGRQFRSFTLIELCREFLEVHGVSTRGMDRMAVARTALQYRSGLHGTSDFPALMASIANKRLRSSYQENPGTYKVWARRAPNAPDFKSISVATLSAMPDLLRTNEHGEFQWGTVSDGVANYSLLTYGRLVGLSRQTLVNDDLRAFDRALLAFGSAAARLENRTVYSELTGNANMVDGVPLFHANHWNVKTGGLSALSALALGDGRTSMRLQKGAAQELLNLAPSYLIVPAMLEQTAYQLTSANYVPSAKAEVNEFREGGRTALEPIVEPILDANSSTAWYLAASTGSVDTVEYCYLDGAEGPFIDAKVGFEVDGIIFKCRLDFVAKAVDYRGLYKGVGV